MKSIKVTQEYLDYQQKLLNSINSWKDEAVCKSSQLKNEDFFDTSETSLKLLAKKYCNNCPVQRHCLYTSLVAGEVYGLWGGLTPKQRKIYFKYILITAQESGIDTTFWSSELDEHFQKNSNPTKVKQVISTNR